MGKQLLRAFLVAVGMGAAAASLLFYALTRAVGPSPSCEHPVTGPAESGTVARSLRSGGIDRCYLLHLPDGLDPAAPAPLVISLHGLASNPDQQQVMTGWTELADAEGFAVAYPQGTQVPQRWNADPTIRDSTTDDVRFLREMIAEIESLIAIDPARIFLNGMSNGGAMTLRAVCDLGDPIAAAGLVAAPVTEALADCAPPRPVPTIIFHGTADPIVPWEGVSIEDLARPEGPIARALRLGHRPLAMLPVSRWVEARAEQNGCSPNPEPLATPTGVVGIRYLGCDQNAEVVYYTVEGGGHSWPGGARLPGWLVGETSGDIDASAVMWEFFLEHPLSDTP